MYFRDESFFSFLFRTQLLHGCFDFSNLLTFGGRRRSHLKAQQKLMPVYKRIDEAILYSILNDDEREQTSFSHPYIHLSLVKDFFQKDFSRYQLNRCDSFRFCDLCIYESYSCHGVGYLKHHWDVTKYCEWHNKSLSIFLPTSYEHTIKSISEIISGNLPHARNIYTYPIAESKPTRGIGKIIRPFSSVYIKPCALLLLREWVTWNKEELLTVLPRKAQDPNGIELFKDISKNMDSYVKLIFENKGTYKLEVFDDFLSARTLIATEKYGVCRKDSFIFKVLKDRGLDCKFNMDKSICSVCGMSTK